MEVDVVDDDAADGEQDESEDDERDAVMGQAQAEHNHAGEQEDEFPESAHLFPPYELGQDREIIK